MLFLLCLCLKLANDPPPSPAPVRRTNSRNFFDLSEDEILDPSAVELGAGKLTKFINNRESAMRQPTTLIVLRYVQL